MKSYYSFVIFFVFQVLVLQAQTIECPGDTTELSISGYKSGSIQWQFSSNDSDWIEIPDSDTSEHKYVLKESGSFRAKVMNGNCSYISDTVQIILSSQLDCNIRDSLIAISKRTSIGAIRWDAGWVGDYSPISVISQNQLSPEKFRFRTPFFASIHTPDSLTVNTNQLSMDQEIAYAKNAGIHYWLYGWFPANSGFANPLNYHLSSSIKDDMKFCYILHSKNWQYVKNEMPLTLSRMKESNYMKIDGKPLVFLMHNTWTINDINLLRTESKNAGIDELYLVFMNWTGTSAIQDCVRFAGQATSAYCNWGDGGISYADFKTATEAKWNTYKSSKYSFIPFVTSGWDPRPIIEYYNGLDEADSISLSTWYPKPADDHFVLTATSHEVAAHLKAGLDWVEKYPAYSKPNTVIIYAWNECTEGGFIIPVAETDSSAINYGAKRLDAIKLMLNEYWNK